MLQRGNKADAYSPLSALAKRQSRLSLHGGKLIDVSYQIQIINWLSVYFIDKCLYSNDTPNNCKKRLTSQVLLFFLSAI